MKFNFKNSHGENLVGRLEMPAEAPRFFAIFAHCFTCSMNVKAASRISKGLSDRGIAVLRFDFTGLGNSDGDFANTNFSSNVDDLLVAAQALQSEYEAPKLLVGHSLGGAAVLMAASKLESVSAVATIGSPSEPAHVAHLFEESLADIQEKGSAKVNVGGRKFLIKKQFLDDLESKQVEKDLGALKKSLMIFHSPVDKVVSIDNARKIYQAAKHPKSFISLDGADHMLSKTEDAEFVADVLSSWALRFL